MTTRATLLNYIDRELGDTAKKYTTTDTGDGSKTVFDLHDPYTPIIPASEAITVADDSPELQVRDTDYTINNETGQVTFTAAPANTKTITSNFQHSYFSHQRKIDELNHCLKNLLFQYKTDNESIVSNGVVLADFESGETWGGTGSADTTRKKTGRQGVRLESSGSKVETNQTGLTLDMKGKSTDNIIFYCFVDDADVATAASIKFHETQDSKVFSYDFTSKLSDGWNRVQIARSDFTNTGSADWQSIVEIEFEYTSSSLSHITFDNVCLIYSDYIYKYDLPSWVREIVDVRIYDTDLSTKSVFREWDISRGTGTGGVDELVLLQGITGGHQIEIYGYGNFTSLSTDATTTDLPSRAEHIPALWVAHALMRTEEIKRDRFDKLPATANEKAVNPSVNMRTSKEFLKMFEEESARCGLAQTFSGFSPIINH